MNVKLRPVIKRRAQARWPESPVSALDFNSVQQNEWIENLKCTTCNNYLSHFPVFISSNNENVCGRCVTSAEGDYIRNEVFEVVSQYTKFPCRYQSQGCYEKLVPKHIPNHENMCPYKTIKCPTSNFTQCQAEISYQNLIKHCQTDHADRFLNNGRFEVDLSAQKTRFYLMEHDSQLINVKTKFQPEKTNFYCTLLREENEKKFVVQIPYQLSFKCGNRELSVTNAQTADISFNSLIDSKEKVASVSVKVFIGAKRHTTDVDTMNEQLVNLLKCPSCSDYLVKSTKSKENLYHDYNDTSSRVNAFFNRNSLKTTCNNCNKGSNAPFLEKLGALLTFPCKNAKQGCHFASHLDELQNHQTKCRFSVQPCPIKDYTNCAWSGTGLDFYSHFCASHQKMLLESSNLSEKFVDMLHSLNNAYDNYSYNYSGNPGKFLKSFLLRFAQKFFHLIFWEQNQKYYWSMEMLGEFTDGFRYDVEISNVENDTKMIISNSCSKHSSKNELSNNLHKCSYLPRDQFQQLENFEVRIFKN